MAAVCCAGCGRPQAPQPEGAATQAPAKKFTWPARLSEFDLFESVLPTSPAGSQGSGPFVLAKGVTPYGLNTPLFSDYSWKYRHVRLPDGAQATYHGDAAFDFPDGTVLAKTFAYPDDMRRDDSTVRLIETRVLVKHDGEWQATAYLWNGQQTDAELARAGHVSQVSWIHDDGSPRELDYLVPNVNQCKGCHQTAEHDIMPLGPKGRNLNGDFSYAAGTANQLAHWQATGILAGLDEPIDAAPRAAVWDDTATGDLAARARAYLDVNCAHCHNPAGAARTTGLDLSLTQSEPARIGVWKTPVAAGRGAGGLLFNVVPGKPDESIVLLRIYSLEPQVMMPELGRRMIHDEGVELIRQWIASLDPGAGVPDTPGGVQPNVDSQPVDAG
ncbi:MAG: hypothetical protein KDA63_07525 [Planctomycetales bacterium]|nr:hypothetical protein [Planctomycetales bacterium]